jgi:hypothetical protein
VRNKESFVEQKVWIVDSVIRKGSGLSGQSSGREEMQSNKNNREKVEQKRGKRSYINIDFLVFSTASKLQPIHRNTYFICWYSICILLVVAIHKNQKVGIVMLSESRIPEIPCIVLLYECNTNTDIAYVFQ